MASCNVDCDEVRWIPGYDALVAVPTVARLLALFAKKDHGRSLIGVECDDLPHDRLSITLKYFPVFIGGHPRAHRL